jgi:hypothetical protein
MESRTSAVIMILGVDPISNVRYRISSIIAGDSIMKPNQNHVESTCVGIIPICNLK